jgi:hypothetical protein
MFVACIVPEVPLRARGFSIAWQCELDDRILANKTRARRRWVLRTGLVLGITSLLLIGLLAWRQDAVALLEHNWTAQRSCEAVQAHLDRTGLLAAALPSGTSPGFMYASYADRFYAQRAARPFIIAASPEAALNLRPHGRSVIVYENGKVHVEWMTVGAFADACLAQTRDAEAFERHRLAQPVVLP